MLCDQQGWDTTFLSFTPKFIITAISVFLSPTCYLLQKLGRTEALSWILTPFALIGSIAWLGYSAGVIVDVIKFLSVSLDLNKTLLSCTLLAVGNTLADLFANSSLSSLGFSVMACTGAISGQVFNLIVGLGLNMIKGSQT